MPLTAIVEAASDQDIVGYVIFDAVVNWVSVTRLPLPDDLCRQQDFGSFKQGVKT